MRLASVALFLALATPAWAADAPCPAPVVKVRGPCPTEVRCSNLDEIHCPVCPAPPVVNCPSPCPPLPVKECPPCLAPAPEPQTPSTAAPEPRHGVWGLPLTLGYLPGYETSLMWTQTSAYKHVDTRVESDYAHSYFAGAGISYQYPSKLQVSLQGLYLPHGDVDAVWSRRVSYGDAHVVTSGTAQTSTSGGRWGAMVTVAIPLGGGGR